MTNHRITDMWAPIVPTPEVMAHMRDHFPEAMLGYIRVFWKREPTTEALRAGLASVQMSDADVIQALDAAGFSRSLITGFDEKTSAGCTFIPNELVAGLAERHPDRFIPFAGVDIFRGSEGVREFERCILNRGFKGLSLRPFMIDLPADDRRYYPFYEKCVELDVPLSIHTSANWTVARKSDLGHPRHIDEVACDLPELKIIMSHAGYPWVLEAVLCAWKHENVYLELAAHRPRYLSTAGTGWEPLFTFGQTTIQDKILFGTGWFLLGRPPAGVAKEFLALPVKPEVMKKWLSGNAERLLNTSDSKS